MEYVVALRFLPSWPEPLPHRRQWIQHRKESDRHPWPPLPVPERFESYPNRPARRRQYAQPNLLPAPGLCESPYQHWQGPWSRQQPRWRYRLSSAQQQRRKHVRQSHRPHFQHLGVPASRCPMRYPAFRRCRAPALLTRRLSYTPHSDGVHGDHMFVQYTVQSRRLEEFKNPAKPDADHFQKVDHMTTAELNTDFTAKARIRQVALELFALNGADATSMRAISSRAGVTVGLITHHFGTKAGLIQAVEDDIVSGIEQAIAYKESDATVDGVAKALDQRLLDHVNKNPLVVAYLRRMMLIESGGQGSDLTARFTRMALRQIKDLRRHGVASTSRDPEDQVMQVMLVQLGQLLMQPFVHQIAGNLNRDPEQYRLSLRKTRG